MKKFISRILILILVNIVVYHLVIYLLYKDSFLSSVCTAPKNESYDFVLMGTSHTQVFYQYIVEGIIPKKMKNLASGASGVIPQKIQLECFFEAKNKTKQVVYLLDPWALYSSRWNESNYIMQQEGIEYLYLLKLLENNVDKKVLFNYFRDKLIDNYDKFMRGLLIPKAEALTLEEQRAADLAEDKQRLGILYNEGMKDKLFSRYAKEVEKVILLARKNNARIAFIIPPTLMGDMPGEDRVIKLLSNLKKKYVIDYFDFSNEIQNKHYYWDREHLNKDGVEYFTQNFLKNIIK